MDLGEDFEGNGENFADEDVLAAKFVLLLHVGRGNDGWWVGG